MNFRYVREFYAAVAVSRAVRDHRMPLADDLKTLGIAPDSFSHLRRR
ncbi:hypothetical protein [Pararhizobium haloflavum]|nr:hypothetical protein [Pararhizobium haloflavum]